MEKKELETAMTSGANDYIRKPFEADELLRVIQNYLRERFSH